MTTVFESETRLGAWLEATEYLLKHGSSLNVILSISSPGSDGIVANKATAIMDKFLVKRMRFHFTRLPNLFSRAGNTSDEGSVGCTRLIPMKNIRS